MVCTTGSAMTGDTAGGGATATVIGLSGAIRRLAYERFSEARLAHWLLPRWRS